MSDKFGVVELFGIWLVAGFFILVGWGLWGEVIDDDAPVYSVLCEVPNKEGIRVVKRKFALRQSEYLGLYHSRAGIFDFVSMDGVRVISPRCWYMGGEEK